MADARPLAVREPQTVPGYALYMAGATSAPQDAAGTFLVSPVFWAGLREVVREESGAADVDAVYAERNALVLALAWAAHSLGAVVGVLDDPEQPSWPVLVIDTPSGQVSWHLPEDAIPVDMPAYPGEWDGHTTETKYQRLATGVQRHDFNPDPGEDWESRLEREGWS